MPAFLMSVAWIMKMGKGIDIQECYRILKVEQGAEWTDIKKSFHRLAWEYHPDRNAGNRVSEYFYQVKVIPGRSPKVRTLNTHEGPIKYLLPKKVNAGQSFVLKSRPHPKTGKMSHHILVVDLI